MPEQPGDRPDTDLDWAEGPSPNAVIDPAAKAVKGWWEGSAPGSGDADKHPAGYENWLDREHGRHVTHLEAISPRQFDDWPDVWAALGAVPAVPELLRIAAPAAGQRARGEPYFNISSPATGGAGASDVCTDNEWIYFIGGSTSLSIVAVKLSDGTLQWEQIPGATAVIGLTCDGAYVYWARTAQPGIWQRATADGSAVATGGASGGVGFLRSNGAFVVGLNPSGSAGSIAFFAVAPASVAETGTTAVSTSLAAAAIDDTHCYVGGTRAGGNDVWSHKLSTRAVGWSVPLSGAAIPTVTDIVTDGDVVYVATDRVALAVGFANVFALSRIDGSILWTLDAGSAANIKYLAVDDSCLYAVDGSSNLWVYRLRFGGIAPPLVDLFAGSFARIVADGISVIGGDGANAIKRNWIGAASKLFQRVAGDDVNRRPFFTQCVPVDGRI